MSQGGDTVVTDVSVAAVVDIVADVVAVVVASVVDKEAEVLIKLSHDELTQFFCKCWRRMRIGKKD